MRRIASSTNATVFGPAAAIGSGTSIASTVSALAAAVVVCRLTSAASSMPAPTSSTNEKATCAVAKIRSRRFVPEPRDYPELVRYDNTGQDEARFTALIDELLKP